LPTVEVESHCKAEAAAVSAGSMTRKNSIVVVVEMYSLFESSSAVAQAPYCD